MAEDSVDITVSYITSTVDLIC